MFLKWKDFSQIQFKILILNGLYCSKETCYLHLFSKISFLPVGKHQLCIQSKHHLLREYPPHSILNPIRCWPRADLESMHEKWTLKWVFWCFMQKPILVSVGLWSFSRCENRKSSESTYLVYCVHFMKTGSYKQIWLTYFFLSEPNQKTHFLQHTESKFLSLRIDNDGD